jgi:RNA polymerase sigma-70 factor (ECF subfamily)
MHIRHQYRVRASRSVAGTEKIFSGTFWDRRTLYHLEVSGLPSITRWEEAEIAASAALSDEEIVCRVRSGETALYEILMRRYNARLYRVARSILRDEAAAEDVMQEAYVRAFQHLASFEGTAKFSTWLTKIAVYEALGRLRRRGKNIDIESIFRTDSAMSNRRDPERQAYDQELRVVMERAIDSLPEGYRSVFVLRIVECLSVAETAGCLDIGEETVKTRLHRARALLRRDLQQRAGIVAMDAYPFHLSRCQRVVDAVLHRLTKDGGTPAPEMDGTDL